MSSIITAILSSTVGLLWNKARNATAAKLQDGDVSDEKIREIVVRELNDIKTKLDGLSRKDLLSSYCFLREGVELLNACLDRTEKDRSESSTMSSDVASAILNEVLELTRAVEKLKIKSCTKYETAKERFKDSRKKATEAFCNESLGIDDRIFAAKLRVVSEILENLESPETAITGCLSFLRDLHSLPAIREIFSVYLNGGVKSLLGKEERAANVKSVMMINYVLFQFTFQFANKLTDWLTRRAGIIELADRSFNPVLEWQKVSSRKSMGRELSQPPNELVLDERIYSYISVVNSRGEIIVKHSDDEVKIISRTGETNVVKLSEPQGEFTEQGISAIAVDKDNNIHVVSHFKRCRGTDVVTIYVLNVLDDSYNVKHACTLGFLEKSESELPLYITINKNNDTIIIQHDDSGVYVCDSSDKLRHKFERDSRSIRELSISNRDEIIIESDDTKAINIYTEEGNLMLTVKLPEDHIIWRVAFHFVLGKIIILSHERWKNSCFLLCYSEEGELESSTFFCYNIGIVPPNITSHPGGPVAVVREGRITFI